MNNRYPQTPSMNLPPSIPRDYPYRSTPMPTSNPLYPSGIGFAPNMSATPYASTAFISGNPSNSSYPAASSYYLLVPNNPYPVSTSPYPASSNNPYLASYTNLYPAYASPYLASSNSAYPASTSAFPTSSNSCYPAIRNSPNTAPTSAYPSSTNVHYPASTSSYLATSYPARASTNQPPDASSYPSMESRTYDSKFRSNIMNNRYPQTPSMNLPPCIARDYSYRPTPMPTSNPLYPSGIGFAPNMSASPYPSAAFNSGNPSNNSCPAASSSCLLVPNNPYLVFTSPYPASFNNSYPASTSNYPASSNSAYPVSASGFPTSSNSCYPTSCNSPNTAPTSAYLSCSNVHYPASTSSYLATSYPARASTNQPPCASTSYPARASTNQPPCASPYPSMESRTYDSKFRSNVNETNDDALNINAFPNEIILEVFGYLTQNQLGQIARVCRRWNMLTKSSVLWRKVNVKFSPSHGCQTTIAESFINTLPSRVTSIKLDFTETGSWIEPLDFEELCLRLQEKCPHLEELILVDSDLSNSLFSVIVVCIQLLQDVKNLIFHHSTFGCHHSTGVCFGISKIKILELFNCYLHHPSKSPFSKMPHLKQLHLCGTEVDDSWFKDDVSFLYQLHVLNVGRTRICPRIFQAVQNHGHNLKELYLCSSFLQDHDLNFINSLFPHLKTICLRCPYLTCEAVVSFIQQCSSLENVYVSVRVAESFAAHPFVVANRCKSGIVKAIHWNHNHNGDYSHN